MVHIPATRAVGWSSDGCQLGGGLPAAGPPQPDQNAQSTVPAVLRNGGNAGIADDARLRHGSATADDDAASYDRGNDDGRDD